MRRALGFIIGTLIGGIIGSGLAILFAPSSGKELRDQIADRTKGFVAEIRNASDTKRIELQERLEDLRAPRA
jgi:gas vesicle protein